MLDNAEPGDTLWVGVSLTHRKEEKGCCRVSKFSVLQLGDEAGPDPSECTLQFITCFENRVFESSVDFLVVLLLLGFFSSLFGYTRESYLAT